MDKTNIIRQLKQRGYSITETPDKGFLIEKDTFWGRFVYDTGIGQDNSRIKWGRTLLLAVIYGLGILGGIYWIINKGRMKDEVLTLAPK